MEPLAILEYVAAMLGGAIAAKALGARLWKGMLVGLAGALALRLSFAIETPGYALNLVSYLVAASLAGAALRMRVVEIIAVILLAGAAMAATLFAFLSRYGFW